MIFEEVIQNNENIKPTKNDIITAEIKQKVLNETKQQNGMILEIENSKTNSKLNKEENKEQKIEKIDKKLEELISDSELSLEYEVSNRISILEFSSKFKKHEFIPEEYLGDLLEIYTFYKYFDDLLDGPIFEIEELWACIFYKGDKYLDLVQDMHMIIINMFLENLETNKMRYESLAQKKNYSLLLMFHSGYLKEKFKEMLLTVNWPDFLREILYVYKHKVNNWEEVVEILETITISSYNKLTMKNKIKVFLALIKVAEELTTFKSFHSSKSERAQELLKKKGETQRLIIDIKHQKIEFEEKFKESEILLENLEKKKHEELNSMEKVDLHKLVRDVKKAKTNKNNLDRKLNLLEGRLNKNEKKLVDILRELPFTVHPSIALGIDVNKNVYWIFFFHPEIIYKMDKNGNWEIYKENINELINELDKNDRRQNSLRHQFLKLIEYNFIEHKKSKDIENLDFYMEDIFNYETIYKEEERKIKTRKHLSNLKDKKFDLFYSFLEKINTNEKCEDKFLRDLIFYIEEELMGYLNMREAFWIEEQSKKIEFLEIVKNLEDVKDYNIFLKQFERNIAQISTYYLEEESEDEEIEERPKIKTIKIDDENEEYQFKRRKRGINLMEIEEDEEIPGRKKKNNWKIKKSNLKFWNYHVQQLKKMWRELISVNKTKSIIFFSLVIFGTILIRFITKKIDKMNEEEEKQRILKEEEHQERRLKKKKNSGNGLLKRYTMRKNRYANKKNNKYCKECQEMAEMKNSIKCYSCENLFHEYCLEDENDINDNWRCSYCLNKIKNSRMTRKLRKELKYYES